VKSGRWWLTLAYTLATLVAPGVHDHGSGGDDVPESRGDCDEQRPHMADHRVADHGDGPTTCPSCQFRAQHPLEGPRPHALSCPVVAATVEPARPSPLVGSPLRARCRAPPRV